MTRIYESTWFFMDRPDDIYADRQESTLGIMDYAKMVKADLAKHTRVATQVTVRDVHGAYADLGNITLVVL